MGLEHNVKTVHSKGGPCLACETPIKSGETALAVHFKIPVMLGVGVNVEQEIHAKCAMELRDIFNSLLPKKGTA